MIYTTDRTTIETDWECGQKRYWYKHAEGNGIVPSVQPEYFADGTILHAHLCDLVLGRKSAGDIIDTIPLSEGDQLELEKNLRLAGWLRGFEQFVLPVILERYEIVNAERECILAVSDGTDELHHAFTPDLEVRRKSDGILGMIDWKTTGSLSFGWAHKWPWQVQMHLNMAGMEQEYGEKCGFGLVLGLYKGYWGRGYTSHPYIYAYRSPTGVWKDRGYKGWDRVPSSEYPDGGVIGWVESLGQDGANKSFRWSDPIHYNPRLTKRLLADRLRREREIADYLDHGGADEGSPEHASIFEARYSKCTPQVGSECAYKSACWNATIGADPLGSGQYVKRIPHHEIEVIE